MYPTNSTNTPPPCTWLAYQTKCLSNSGRFDSFSRSIHVHVSSHIDHLTKSEDAHPPTLVSPWINHDLVRERITLARGDWRDMIGVCVGYSDDLHRRLLQHHLHRSPHLCPLCRPVSVSPRLHPTLRQEQPTRFRPRSRQRHVQRPLLPADLLLGFGGEPGLAPALLEELNRHLPADGGVVGGVQRGRAGVVGVVDLALERGGALVDERLELDVGHEGQGEVQEVPVARADGGEESVEEDGVEDAWVWEIEGQL